MGKGVSCKLGAAASGMVLMIAKNKNKNTPIAANVIFCFIKVTKNLSYWFFSYLYLTNAKGTDLHSVVQIISFL